MVKKIFISLFLFFSAVTAFAQDVTVKAFTDTTDYWVGDRIKYTIRVTSPKDVSILNVAFRDSISNLEVWGIDEPVVENTGQGKITSFGYTLSRFDSATITIPPIPVYYRTGKDGKTNKFPYMTPEQAANDPTIKTVFSNPVIFQIHLVTVNIQEDIKDIKEPVTIPMDWKVIVLLILIVLLLAGLGYYLYQRYRRKKEILPAKRIVILPPHVVALNALKQLEDKKLWQEGKVKEYHSEITGIIRKYFEERFHLPALELTTSEVMLHLRNIPDDAARKILNTTYNFLSNADLVKFAKYTPMNIINEEMMKQAYEIINVTSIPVQQETISGEKNV
jgi:hypothetical protein